MGMYITTSKFYGIHIGDPESDDVPKFITDYDGDYFEYDDYSEEKLGEGSLVEISATSFYDYNRYYLIIKSTEETTSDGRPLYLSANSVDTKWDKLIKDACEELNMEFSQPKWMVGVSYF